MKSTRNLYLKAMYMLEAQYGKIRVTDIADYLGFTKSSVSKALKRLAFNNLIEYETYGNIILSVDAKCIAEKLLSKEDLLELFFVGILNVSKEQALKDIDVISEYVSDETKVKLKNYIARTFHVNDDNCKCSYKDYDKCNSCETNIIKTKITSNPKWVEVLKEKE